MRNLLALLLLIALVAPVAAAPAKPASPKPKTVGIVARPVAKPTLMLGRSFSSADLGRIAVGNQAGVLKVYGRDRSVAFIKDAPGISMQGIDGTQWAPLEARHRVAILAALDIGGEEAPVVATAIMRNWKKISQREGIALLGVIGSGGASPELIRFLEAEMSGNKNVVVRRQAVLSLALLRNVDARCVDSVVAFMSRSRNAWETFTTKQFFEYHKSFVQSLPQAASVRARLQGSGNPYGPDIAATI